MGGVSVFQLGTPLAPGRARTHWDGYIRLPARRSAIGGLYDHRPVAPRSPLGGLFRDPGSIQRTDPGRNRFETTRPRSAYPRRRFGPDPSALPRDGDSFEYGGGFNADDPAARKSEKRLKSLGSIPDTPGIERRERSYFSLSSPCGGGGPPNGGGGASRAGDSPAGSDARTSPATGCSPPHRAPSTRVRGSPSPDGGGERRSANPRTCPLRACGAPPPEGEEGGLSSRSLWGRTTAKRSGGGRPSAPRWRGRGAGPGGRRGPWPRSARGRPGDRPSGR